MKMFGNKKKGIIVSLLILVVLVIFVRYILFLNTKSIVDVQFIVEPTELNLAMNNSAQLKAYLHDVGSGEKEDVTNEADWSTSDYDVVAVGNKAVKGQVIATKKGGDVLITVVYDGQTIIVPIGIFRPEMEVICEPGFVGDNIVGEDGVARVGDVIRWIGVYKKMGAPNYFYKWTGTDGLESDWAVVLKTYNTPGLKEVHFWTKDTAGTIAEADCSIMVTE